jgi:hypothetical protein
MLLNTLTGNAGLIAAAFAEKLLGRQVITQEWGLFQGGLCTVIALTPDANAPEIVCQVQHNTTGEEMGIFADEILSVIEPNSHAAFADAAMALQLGMDKLAERDDLIHKMNGQIDRLLELTDERISQLEKMAAQMAAPIYIGVDLGRHESTAIRTFNTADIACGGDS